MLKYAKVVNEETKLCEVGIGTNAEFYQSIGMVLMDVEQAYDGSWHVEGYAPEKPVEVMQKEVRNVRDTLLQDTDVFMLPDYPITDTERELYKSYRSYLRDYTQTENWYLSNPLTFEEWQE